MTQPRPRNSRFFERDSGGGVRLRIRLSAHDAALIEEAAGQIPLIQWILTTLSKTAQGRVTEIRKDWPTDPPDEP